MKKTFIPCYQLIFKFYDYDDKVFRKSKTFELDYFLKDKNGHSMLELIDANWCVPYEHTSIEFYRIKQ